MGGPSSTTSTAFAVCAGRSFKRSSSSSSCTDASSAAHDSTTSILPRSGPSGRQPPLQPQPLRKISLAVGKSVALINSSLDSSLTHLLQDGDSIRLSPDRQSAVPEFSPRNPRVLRPLRKLWVFLCFAGMLSWLLVDMLYMPDDNQGLVQGITENYVIGADPFDMQGISSASSSNSDTTRICSCTYTSVNHHYVRPPYTMFVARNNTKKPNFLTFLGWCDNPSNLPALDFKNKSNPGPLFIAGVLDELAYQLTAIRAVAPASPILLSPDGWKAARFAEVFRSTMAITTAAQARIANAPLSAIPSSADVGAGLDAAARLQASFSFMLGRLLNMSEEVLTFDMVDRQTNSSTPLNCSKMPAADQLPVAMLEWCQAAEKTGTFADNEAHCQDAYVAYVNFCSPVLCHQISPKTPYLQAMQILVAIGGMYSIIALFAFAIIWRLIFCNLDKRVDLDSWLDGCCRGRGGRSATCTTLRLPGNACSSAQLADNKVFVADSAVQRLVSNKDAADGCLSARPAVTNASGGGAASADGASPPDDV